MLVEQAYPPSCRGSASRAQGRSQSVRIALPRPRQRSAQGRLASRAITPRSCGKLPEGGPAIASSCHKCKQRVKGSNSRGSSFVYCNNTCRYPLCHRDCARKRTRKIATRLTTIRHGFVEPACVILFGGTTNSRLIHVLRCDAAPLEVEQLDKRNVACKSHLVSGYEKAKGSHVGAIGMF